MDDCDDVFFAQYQKFVSVDLHGLASILAEQHALTDLHVGLDALAIGVAPAGANSDDLTLIGFFRRAIRDDDARGGLGFLIESLDDNAIV
ncbi:hypothetical protein WS68_03570 [Burkholderia sp. TSV86]|nr:hypothetical protein WS68_03570 [Burkholderia sp. TSV86]